MGERLNPGQPGAGGLVLEMPTPGGPHVPQELGRLLTRMAEVADEEVDVTIVVQIPPGRADRVSPAGRTIGRRNIGKGPRAVVQP